MKYQKYKQFPDSPMSQLVMLCKEADAMGLETTNQLASFIRFAFILRELYGVGDITFVPSGELKSDMFFFVFLQLYAILTNHQRSIPSHDAWVRYFITDPTVRDPYKSYEVYVKDARKITVRYTDIGLGVENGVVPFSDLTSKQKLELIGYMMKSVFTEMDFSAYQNFYDDLSAHLLGSEELTEDDVDSMMLN